jgi:hypothetical protein
MAARFLHGSAVPSTLDIILREMEVEEDAPVQRHRTDYGNIIGTYVLGKRTRSASLELMVTTQTEYNNFWSFYRTAVNANTRFTFIADTTNDPSDSWSAFFISEPKFQRDPDVPGSGSRKAGTISVDIQDDTYTLP